MCYDILLFHTNTVFFLFSESVLFLLNLSHERFFNQVDLKTVMEATQKFLNKEIVTVLSRTITQLEKAGCTHTECVSQLEGLYKSLFAPDLFQGLKTQYRQHQYYTKHFGMINPTKVFLP